jgi:hypothetical protein
VIESFGHSEYITKVAKYAHLSDRDPKQRSTGLIPADLQTLRLIEDLYREAASIFPALRENLTIHSVYLAHTPRRTAISSRLLAARRLALS